MNHPAFVAYSPGRRVCQCAIGFDKEGSFPSVPRAGGVSSNRRYTMCGPIGPPHARTHQPKSDSLQLHPRLSRTLLLSSTLAALTSQCTRRLECRCRSASATWGARRTHTGVRHTHTNTYIHTHTHTHTHTRRNIHTDSWQPFLQRWALPNIHPDTHPATHIHAPTRLQPSPPPPGGWCTAAPAPATGRRRQAPRRRLPGGRRPPEPHRAASPRHRTAHRGKNQRRGRRARGGCKDWYREV